MSPISSAEDVGKVSPLRSLCGVGSIPHVLLALTTENRAGPHHGAVEN